MHLDNTIQATLLFLKKDDEILLAMKKRGFGAHLYNGVGGKVDPGETIEAAAIRECQEEICVTPHDLTEMAVLEFTFPEINGKPQPAMHVTVYFSESWDGEPKETEEMAPKWFSLRNIPYEKMWQDDPYWLPVVLTGRKVRGFFRFDEANNLLESTVKNLPVSTGKTTTE